MVVVDPRAPAQPALEKAARLSAALAARLDVYACDWHEGLEGRGRDVALARRRVLAAGEAALAALIRDYAPAAKGAELRYELGHPRETAILRQVRSVRPELVVLDSHFHAEARRALFGPADWPLIRDCPVPLLYAKPRHWRAAPRIAAAVDPRHPATHGDRLDARLIETAAGLAHALRGSLYVVHAWLAVEPGFAGPAALGMPVIDAAEVDRLVGGAEQAARAKVSALTRGLRSPRPEIVLLRGAAIETLPGFAEVEGLDVLVLGAVSRSWLYDTLIGATAERLLERVPCDVLVVNGGRAARRRRPARRRAPRRFPV
jgi:universal stress protein E